MRSYRSVVALGAVGGLVAMIASSGCTALLGTFTTEPGSDDASTLGDANSPADVITTMPDSGSCAVAQLECNSTCVAIDRKNCFACGVACADNQICDPIKQKCTSADADSGGAPVDANSPIDANKPVDANAPADANPPVDATMSVDANTPVDANLPTDANKPIDANVPLDGNVDAACVTGSQTDPKNCGVCGHSCGLGSCSAGACQAYVLASLLQPLGIVTDSTYIYFAVSDGSTGTTGYIGQCPVATGCGFAGANITKLDTGLTRAFGVTLVGTTLYWTTEGQNNIAPAAVATLRSCTLKSGTCSTTPQTLKSGNAGSGQYEFMTSSGSEAYAIDRSSIFSSVTTQSEATETSAIQALTASGGTIFFTLTNGLYSVPAPFPNSGTNPTTSGLVAAINGGGLVANTVLGVTTIYWVDAQSVGGAYIETTVVGGAETLLAGGLHAPQDVALDSTNVYWGDSDGTIYYCPRSGCPGSTSGYQTLWSGGPTLSSSGGGGNTITTDGAFVYWSSSTELLMIATPP